MGLFDELVGGGQRQQQFGDFISRYQQGAPYDGISDDEAGQRYSEVAGEVDPQTHQDSARDAFGAMAPDERGQFAGQLQELARSRGVDTGWDGQATDPDTLAGMTRAVHQQSPDLLGALLGGAGGGNPIAKAALAGIAAMAARRMMGAQGGGQGGGLL